MSQTKKRKWYDHSVTQSLKDSVLEILQRESDMDGSVTLPNTFIAEEIGKTSSAVWLAIHHLEAEGKLRIADGKSSQGHKYTQIQLQDF